MGSSLSKEFLKVGDIIQEDDTWKIYNFIKRKNTLIISQNRNSALSENAGELIHGGNEFGGSDIEKKVIAAGVGLRGTGKRFIVIESNDKLWSGRDASKVIIAKEISESNNRVENGLTIKFHQGGAYPDMVNEVNIVDCVPSNSRLCL